MVEILAFAIQRKPPMRFALSASPMTVLKRMLELRSGHTSVRWSLCHLWVVTCRRLVTCLKRRVGFSMNSVPLCESRLRKLLGLLHGRYLSSRTVMWSSAGLRRSMLTLFLMAYRVGFFNALQLPWLSVPPSSSSLLSVSAVSNDSLGLSLTQLLTTISCQTGLQLITP